MTAIIINWTYSFADNDGYLLLRSPDSGATWTTLPTVGLVLTYTDLDVSVGNTYWYQVAATNPMGNGPFSTVFSVFLSTPSVFTVYLNVNAKSDTKPFDGTISSSQIPDVFPDVAYYGDTSAFDQTFTSKLVGDHDLVPGGSAISNTGIVYVVTPNNNTGSITGPSTGSIDTSHYILIPPNTDLPYYPDSFVTINDATSGSNGLLTMDTVSGTTMAMTSSNGNNWVEVGTATYRSDTFTYGNGRYVGMNAPAGNETNAQYSDDGGVTWNVVTIPTSQLLRDSLFDGSLFVACGNNGTIVTSSNGADWGLSSTGVSDQAFRIVYNAGRYVVVGPVSPGVFSTSTGTIYTSTDLVTWQDVSSSVPTTNAYLGVAYSPALGMYLAVGEAGQMASSTDGVQWTDCSNAAPIYNTSLSSVAWNINESYFAASDFGGYIYNSPDGLNWTLNTINPYVWYQGSLYTYILRIDYDVSINKFLVFGTIPPG